MPTCYLHVFLLRLISVRRNFFPRLFPFPRRICPDSRLELMQNLLSGLEDLSILISPKLGCFHRCTVHEFLNCHLLEQLQYCNFGHIPAGAHRTCPLQFYTSANARHTCANLSRCGELPTRESKSRNARDLRSSPSVQISQCNPSNLIPTTSPNSIRV